MSDTVTVVVILLLDEGVKKLSKECKSTKGAREWSCKLFEKSDRCLRDLFYDSEGNCFMSTVTWNDSLQKWKDSHSEEEYNNVWEIV